MSIVFISFQEVALSGPWTEEVQLESSLAAVCNIFNPSLSVSLPLVPATHLELWWWDSTLNHPSALTHCCVERVERILN